MDNIDTETKYSSTLILYLNFLIHILTTTNLKLELLIFGLKVWLDASRTDIKPLFCQRQSNSIAREKLLQKLAPSLR